MTGPSGLHTKTESGGREATTDPFFTQTSSRIQAKGQAWDTWSPAKHHAANTAAAPLKTLVATLSRY